MTRRLAYLLAAGLFAGISAIAPAGAAAPPGPGSVAVGAGHACLVTPAGTVKCWGFNSDGELGNGGPTDGFAQSKTLVVVSGLSGVKAVATGDHHTCALLKAGTVKCWGLNDSGQLGNGTSVTSSKPVSVKGVHGSGLLSGGVALAAGQNHTCALLSAGSGTVKCWGQNNDGVLGDGVSTFERATTPQSVAGLTTVTAISTSTNDTCAVLKAGSVKCWGFSEYGELGPGIYGPGDCAFGDADFGCNPTPLTVKGISGATAISVREHSSCALVKSGKVTCWGDMKKSFVSVPGVSGATYITSSSDSATNGDYSCVVLATRTVKCWGYNHDGELGNGTTKAATAPTAVSGLSGVTAVSAGVTSACARLAAGTAVCWGSNGYGQLGNGSATNRTKPVHVIGY